MALAIAFFGLTLVIIAISLSVTNRRSQHLSKQADIATNIERRASDVAYLSNEYVIEPQERLQTSWESKITLIADDLAQIDPQTPEQQIIVNNMKSNLKRLKGVFTDVSGILSNNARYVADNSATQVSWSRLAVQNQQMAFDAMRLSHIIRDQQMQLRNTNLLLIYALLAFFGAFLISGYFIGYRRLLRSLTELHKGTEIVGSGNLDFSIPVLHKDEIGELSQAFNRMTNDLKGVTASKTELEAEIEERRAAEQALHEERERLSVTLKSIGDGVIATDTEANVILLNGVAEELTGWTAEEAAGRPISEVFNIISEQTRKPAENPVGKALKSGIIVGLANHTALIARDGTERSIADSCAPIRALDGTVIGAVLVFRDISEERKAEILRDALNEINTDLSSTFDTDRILQTAIEKAANALGCEKAAVLVQKNGYLVASHAYGLPDNIVGKQIASAEVHDAENITDAKQPLFLTDSALSEIMKKEFTDDYELTSAMYLPIVTKGIVFGALTFFNITDSSMPLVYTQIDFARKLAASLSLALENAQLYAAEKQIAETLQEALISMPQVLPGIDFSHHYRSATETARVGGDFYDIFPLQPGKIGILIGDVAGKGISAATLTALVQNAIKTLAYQEYSLGEIMERANEIIIRETATSTFATIFLGVLETETGVLRYCSGGHPPAMIRRHDIATELLCTTSPMVGAFENISFEESQTRMEKGDVLVLYTDGVIEARRLDKEFFGQERLLEILVTAKPAIELTHQIFEKVMEFTEGMLNDDLAILSISLNPK